MKRALMTWTRTRPGTKTGIVIVTVAPLLSGCLTAVGPDYAPPDLETPAAYGAAAALPADATAHARWWHGFGDARLDALVERALAENLDIAAAQVRLEEARILAGVAGAAQFPTLDAQSGADSTFDLARSETATRSGREQPVTGSAEAGLSLSWAPDLFGGERRAVEAAEAEARRRALLREDLQRQVAADVVRRYLDIVRDRASLDLVMASLDLQSRTLSLVRQRYAAGLAAALDVSRAEAQVAGTRARRGPLLRDLTTAQAALGVLTGHMDGAGPMWSMPAGVPAFAGGPDIGLPRDLLRSRPDVRAAEAALARATADIGVAEAALYPRLSLPGTLMLTTSGLGTGDVVRTLISTLAASLEIPLFDGGARRGDLAAAEARAREALIAYRTALLAAVAEVETALGALDAARLRVADLREAAATGETAVGQARDLYEQGLVGFLDVLDAERTLLDTRQALLDAETDTARAITDLYAAVGAPVAGSV